MSTSFKASRERHTHEVRSPLPAMDAGPAQGFDTEGVGVLTPGTPHGQRGTFPPCVHSGQLLGNRAAPQKEQYRANGETPSC